MSRDAAFAELVRDAQNCRACPRMEGRRRVLSADNGPLMSLPRPVYRRSAGAARRRQRRYSTDRRCVRPQLYTLSNGGGSAPRRRVCHQRRPLQPAHPTRHKCPAVSSRASELCPVSASHPDRCSACRRGHAWHESTGRAPSACSPCVHAPRTRRQSAVLERVRAVSSLSPVAAGCSQPHRAHARRAGGRLPSAGPAVGRRRPASLALSLDVTAGAGR